SPLVSDTPITPHQLRHSYATSMVNAGMGLYGVMKLLGHMDMRMTLRLIPLS
ncbi:MAG: tyrosine-type recombinase/integrase, partial [Maribacter sp.]|nr:tyrosine-type recombinase/integrase [Maribacter sp.]